MGAWPDCWWGNHRNLFRKKKNAFGSRIFPPHFSLVYARGRHVHISLTSLAEGATNSRVLPNPKSLWPRDTRVIAAAKAKIARRKTLYRRRITRNRAARTSLSYRRRMINGAARGATRARITGREETGRPCEPLYIFIGQNWKHKSSVLKAIARFGGRFSAAAFLS